MKVIVNLLLIPAVAFIANILTVAVLGTFYGINELKEILGGTNTFPIFLAWCAVLSVLTVTQWILVKWRNK